jgi:hypothetical protein
MQADEHLMNMISIIITIKNDESVIQIHQDDIVNIHSHKMVELRNMDELVETRNTLNLHTHIQVPTANHEVTQKYEIIEKRIMQIDDHDEAV